MILSSEEKRKNVYDKEIKKIQSELVDGFNPENDKDIHMRVERHNNAILAAQAARRKDEDDTIKKINSLGICKLKYASQ